MARRIAITLLILPLFLLAGIFQTRAAEEEMPAFQQNDVIVFIGDSITDGGRARTGADYNHTMGQSYAYIISALLGNKLADKNLTFINRGISGNRITDLQGRWKTDVIDLKPNVLSILVGINDTLLPQHEPVEMYE
jgi:lysophospholipase L1-like esterase